MDSLSHERLTVYQRATSLVADVEELLCAWDPKHAVVDHLSRATESVLVNIAEGCRVQAIDAKLNAVDYSLGSTGECAACLDIAVLKALLPLPEAVRHKKRLAEIMSMLIGLRKSWQTPGEIRDYEGELTVEPSDQARGTLFDHERLDVYRTALAAMRWFCEEGLVDSLPGRLFRLMDGAATSVVLNIAEGNSRLARGERRRFLETANRLAVKFSVYVDVCVKQGVLLPAQVEQVRPMILRLAQMTAAMGHGTKDYTPSS